MKKSLVWRAVLIVVVLIAWGYSLFPINDRKFEDIFAKLATAQIEKYQAQEKTSAELVGKLEKEIADIKDPESESAKAVKAELEAAQSTLDAAKQNLQDYDRLRTEAQELMTKEGTAEAPSLAYKHAARGDSTRAAILLRNFIPIPTQPKASNARVLSYVRNKAAGKLHLGLDLRGGTEFVIGFQEKDIPKDRRPEDVRDQIIEILRQRVDSMGVVEPEIKETGDTSISLRMPSVSEDDKAEIRRTIKQTATLRFHLVNPNNSELVQQWRADPKSFTPPLGYKYSEMESERNGEVSTEVLFIQKRPERVKGEQVNRAFATFNEFGNYAVSLEFNSRGAQAFADVTAKNVNNRLAIVLDDKVYSAPNINEAITGGSAQISGNFSAEEARRLAGVIESGNLPVSINIDSEFGTDPTLGRDSIESGSLAAMLGLILVVVFMIIYYRTSGVIAIIALAANILLIMGTLTLTGATVTLPGIAGIVLTIGMAVDANVLIFERIREEMRNMKTIGNAIKAGYSRAFVTIVDSNLTTLITALILYRYGTGSVRGFAVTLSIGILASMFTALVMTRLIFDFLLYKGWLTKLSMTGLLVSPKFDFIALRKVALGLSSILILGSLLTLAIRGKDSLSIDFSGGTAVTFRHTSANAPSVAELRAKLADTDYRDSRIGYKGTATQEGRLLEIVLPEVSTNETTIDLDGLSALIKKEYPQANFELAQTNSVGGLVGARFQNKAIMAGILAAIAIILYVSFRFEFAYGVASVIALVHDVIIAGGVYLISGRQLSLPVIAALLTIMGYSLNDTIVVFDRIREELTLHKDRTYQEIINLGINQTLSRTLLTSLTTLLVVLTLFLFGGGAINDFALVMLAGVVVGTYSSVFVASAIIASWHKHKRGLQEA
jgi:SecD/SecF fusion protein